VLLFRKKRPCFKMRMGEGSRAILRAKEEGLHEKALFVTRNGQLLYGAVQFMLRVARVVLQFEVTDTVCGLGR
jgi:hypothetical protein